MEITPVQKFGKLKLKFKRLLKNPDLIVTDFGGNKNFKELREF